VPGIRREYLTLERNDNRGVGEDEVGGKNSNIDLNLFTEGGIRERSYSTFKFTRVKQSKRNLWRSDWKQKEFGRFFLPQLKLGAKRQ